MGKIARYAWGTDYHDIVLPKLKELDAFLADHGGVQRCYVDTGPILDRNAALRAQPQRGDWELTLAGVAEEELKGLDREAIVQEFLEDAAALGRAPTR